MRAILLAAAVAALAGCKERAGSSSASAADLAPLKPALEAVPPPATPSTETHVDPIGFDWGPPCRVPALQDVEDDGKRARLAFDVVLERGADGLVARMDNMRAIAAPDTAPMAVAIDQALLSIDGAIPAIAVDDNGESRGALDVDRTIDLVVKLLPKSDANLAATLEKTLRSPQWRAVFEQKAGETWENWVGAFTNMDIAPYTVRRDTVDLPSPFGTFKDVAIAVTHHGPVRDAPTLALLSIEQTIEGPELAQMIIGVMKNAMPASAGPAPTFKHARKTDTVTVAIDPVLGRPHRSRHVMAVEIEDKHKRRSRDTAFDWSRATGCIVATRDGSDAAGAAPQP